MAGGDVAEEAEMAAVAVAEAMPGEEELVEEAEAEAEVEEAAEPQPLTPMTQAGATLHLNGEV